MAALGQTPGVSPPEPTDPTLRWRAVYDQIVRDILAGQHPPGSLLPSNAQIQQQWNVSSTTSRRVLAELSEAGWAISQGTRGYIATAGPHDAHYQMGQEIRDTQAPTIADPPARSSQPPLAQPRYQAVSPALPRPQHTVPLAGHIPTLLTTVASTSVQAEPAPADVAYALRLPGPGAPVIVRRHVVADSTGVIPVELWAAYLDAQRVADGPLSKPDHIPGTWPDALTAHTGLPVTAASSQVYARRPDAYEAATLHLTTADIVLVRTTTLLSRDEPLSYSVNVWPADSTRITAERYSLD
ncbi:GntR family transcriptional regulator [Actinomadura monticuli]|uniref:GntR family transcriptional regulator n=1 Tax=Actinomadura monticuli TaxID=3097367 RepID=A0ABV4Q9Y4_9ACTN